MTFGVPFGTPSFFFFPYNHQAMRASQFFLPTLREAPTEAETASHRLLLRAGFIKRVSAGVYSYLPLGLRAIDKVRQIVREEANKAGSVELLMPTLVPFELLEETGRDTVEVLYKTTDRTGRPFALGFTHEEVITDIVRSFIHSYRDMPITLYQIQTKFRDEPRPRAGLMRGKEFIMYDAYSFDIDEQACETAYEAQKQAYIRMFQRMGLETLICDAEAGDIGGGMNQEFMVISEAGEDKVLLDEKTGYAANAERCDIGGDYELAMPASSPKAELVETPNKRTVEEVTEFLNLKPEHLVKTLLLKAGDKNIAALIRGDHELNPLKLARRLGVEKVDLMSAEQVMAITGADVGFAGPIGLEDTIIIADNAIKPMKDFVVGANRDDMHYMHVCHTRDFSVDMFDDIRLAQDGDPSRSGGRLKEIKGIEVGHIFQLGTKYSAAMGATFTTPEGDIQPIVMGCYGLGIGRTLQAIVEVSHDENGIILPVSVAPFEVVLFTANAEDDAQKQKAESIYKDLIEEGIEVLWDDREERAGVKFKDADLIGYPLRVVCGRAMHEGKIEIKWRHKSESELIDLENASQTIAKMIKEEKQRLNA